MIWGYAIRFATRHRGIAFARIIGQLTAPSVLKRVRPTLNTRSLERIPISRESPDSQLEIVRIYIRANHATKGAYSSWCAIRISICTLRLHQNAILRTTKVQRLSKPITRQRFSGYPSPGPCARHRIRRSLSRTLCWRKRPIRQVNFR